MKFLVTGAWGQLGREWVNYLQFKSVTCESYSSDELDITNPENVRNVIKQTKPEVIINCAAYTDVDGAESESEEAFRVNETGVKNLAEVCESIGIKLVHYSTDYVFSGEEQDQRKYPEGYPESADTNPVNVYGQSKLAGEKVLLDSDCDSLLIRVAWLCGRYGSNFVKTMLRIGEKRDQLNVVDDQLGCPSFAFDIVDKTYHLLDEGESGIYHLSCAGKITWADFAEEIFDQKEMDVDVKRIPSEAYSFVARRPKFSLLSTYKAEKTGLRILPWKNGLAQLLEQVEKDNS